MSVSCEAIMRASRSDPSDLSRLPLLKEERSARSSSLDLIVRASALIQFGFSTSLASRTGAACE
jgi:hypothetical protein